MHYPALALAFLFAVASQPFAVAEAVPPPQPKFGVYFNYKGDKISPVPTFEAIKDQLPEPVLEAHPDWVRMYWRCWEIGCKKIVQPPADSLLVSTFIDAAFGKVTGYTYQWDSCFMMMFARYGHFQFPLIHSLDNFYARQLPSGFICREIDGKPRIAAYGHHGGYKDPDGWKNTVNPPLFA